jgi:hypothetical protein
MAAGCWRRTKGHRKPSSRHPKATHVIRSSRTCTTRFATNLPGPERSDSNCPSHERVGLAAERKCRGDQRGSLVSVVFPTGDRGFDPAESRRQTGTPLARDCGPDDGNGQVRHDRRGPNDTPFGIPRAVSLDGRSLGPHHGVAHPGADPGQKQDPAKVTTCAPMSSMFPRS